MYDMGKTKKPEDKAIPKTITVSPRHQQFIEENSLNLSKFVQRKLDEEIEKRNKPFKKM